MKWKKLRLETTTEALDYLGAIAMDLGLEGFEIEDNVPLSEEDKQRMFIDILPELPPDEGVAYVSFYTDEDTDIDALAEQIKQETQDYEGLCDFGTLALSVSETEDKDWINNWKQFFKPFRVDDTIVIKPTWEELEEHRPGDMIIEIDPGTAFGTGAHETTKLCILNLKKYLKGGERLLDVGCGSGILSIVGMKLGCRNAIGIDVDDNASHTSVDNTAINGIPSDYVGYISVDGGVIEPMDGGVRYLTGNVIDDARLRGSIGLGCYDVVVANILADIIIPLSGVVSEFMHKGSLFISSGIINTKEEAVREALLENGFEIVEVTHMNDWVSITARL